MARRAKSQKPVHLPEREAQLPSRVLEHLRRVVRALQSQSLAIEAATGLTGPQFWALREVAQVKAGITNGELARRLALHPANAGRLAERLAARGLVSRATPPADRRVVLLQATPAGVKRSRLPVSAPPQADLLARLGELPGPRLASIERALAELAALIGADSGDAPPLFDAESPSRARRRG